MKLLLDECLPVQLRPHVPGHDVFTVEYLGWKGIRNGRLLAMAAGDGFDALVTTDLGMEHSQNRAALRLLVMLLHAGSNALDDLLPLVPDLLTALAAAPSQPAFAHVRRGP